MKKYEKPKIEIIKFEFQDIIVASGCDQSDNGKHKGWDKGKAQWKEHNDEP